MEGGTGFILFIGLLTWLSGVVELYKGNENWSVVVAIAFLIWTIGVLNEENQKRK